jgi:hypothetical protein
MDGAISTICSCNATAVAFAYAKTGKMHRGGLLEVGGVLSTLDRGCDSLNGFRSRRPVRLSADGEVENGRE